MKGSRPAWRAECSPGWREWAGNVKVGTLGPRRATDTGSLLASSSPSILSSHINLSSILPPPHPHPPLPRIPSDSSILLALFQLIINQSAIYQHLSYSTRSNYWYFNRSCISYLFCKVNTKLKIQNGRGGRRKLTPPKDTNSIHILIFNPVT